MWPRVKFEPYGLWLRSGRDGFSRKTTKIRANLAICQRSVRHLTRKLVDSDQSHSGNEDLLRDLGEGGVAPCRCARAQSGRLIACASCFVFLHAYLCSESLIKKHGEHRTHDVSIGKHTVRKTTADYRTHHPNASTVLPEVPTSAYASTGGPWRR